MHGPIRTFWAKLTHGSDGDVAWHPLPDHCADVAACCRVLLEDTILGDRLAALSGQERLSPSQVGRLSTLAALHDIGKFNLGFQNKALPHPPFQCGHLREVAAFLDKDYRAAARLRESLSVQEIDTWGDALLDLLVATISHHGRPIGMHHPVDPRCWEPSASLDPFAGVADLVDRTRRWFPAAWEPGGDLLPEAPAFQHAWCGLVTLADWIGSDERFFPFSESLEIDRMELASAAARDALRRLGLTSTAARRSLGPRPPDFARVAPGLTPRPAQAALLEVSPRPEEGSVALLEAETGSGKTEAALAYFARLFQAGLVQGLYFALPTRTAATQIHHRVRAAVGPLFPDDESRPAVVWRYPATSGSTRSAACGSRGSRCSGTSDPRSVSATAAGLPSTPSDISPGRSSSARSTRCCSPRSASPTLTCGRPRCCGSSSSLTRCTPPMPT